MNYVEIPILETAQSCGIQIHENDNGKTEVRATCPFCHKKKHLYLHTNSNRYHCQFCKAGGNSVTLYATLHSVDNLTAFLALTGGNIIPMSAYRKNFTHHKDFEAPIKPLAVRHDVYYDMLQMLALSVEHRTDLLNRGLDNSTIDLNMYRTMPKQYDSLCKHVIKALLKNYDLSGIPGFYPKDGEWHMYTPKGLLIPYCTQHGYIQGLQIRRDNVDDDKFRWFSSSFAKGGSKSGSYIHVSNWRGSKTAIITEGGLKADISSFLMNNACIIGLAGVDSIKGLEELLVNMDIEEAIEAFDIDKFTNERVIRALRNLDEIIAKTGIKYRHTSWIPKYKGLDDFQLALKAVA